MHGDKVGEKMDKSENLYKTLKILPLDFSDKQQV